MQFIGKTKIDFIGMKKLSFAISGIVALIGILAIVQIGRGKANMGIDFAGGTSLQLKFDQPLVLEDVRKAFSAAGMKDIDLQEVKEGNKLLVKVRKDEHSLGATSASIKSVLTSALPNNPFVVESTTEIGPAIGAKLRSDTLIAVAIALLGIILYIWFRFDLTFGVAATIATLHDVLAMFAVFFILHKEVNLLLITAVLTIAGYSLTDTVVVFDRIRENLKKGGKEALATIFNRSINEVLSRSIITSLTTFLAATSLFLFGGEVIHDFALALVVGIAVGTYSSVFVASPIVVVWQERAVKKA
ncbi:MAG TPA: protein translocase subunit SecF [Geobacterales bacterium]|nr:protein translocase subunit SecF [Geobacterales bacterium]